MDGTFASLQMKKRVNFPLGLFLLVSIFLPGIARAVDGSGKLSYADFAMIAGDLAPKVNLFQSVCKEDPSAEFFGGTTRDFLYWVKGQFQSCRTPEEVGVRMTELRSRPSIDVREFMAASSDVDVASHLKGFNLDPTSFGVKKVDPIDRSRFNPSSSLGRSEIDQGYLPAEKIRISCHGKIATAPFGNGAQEILESRLTVHFSPTAVFDATHYAKLGVNDPILLALRYVRLVSLDHAHRFGKKLPNYAALDTQVASLRTELRSVFSTAVSGARFSERVTHPQFVYKLNEAVKKSMNAFVNPTASLYLLKELGMLEVIDKYTGLIEPVNQYLFARGELTDAQRAYRGRYQADPLIQPASKVISDLTVYHGTPTEEAFRAILSQGAMPSVRENLLAGHGLYAVRKAEMRTAVTYAQGSQERVIRFKVSPDASVFDWRSNAGKTVLANFKADHPGATYDTFAEALGIDAIDYSLPDGSRAFVFKNSRILGEPDSELRPLMSYGRLLRLAGETKTEADLGRFVLNYLSTPLVETESVKLLKALHAFPELAAPLMGTEFTQAFGGVKASVRDAVRRYAFAQLSFRSILLKFDTPLAKDPEIQSFLRAISISMEDLGRVADRKDLDKVVDYFSAVSKGQDAKTELRYLQTLKKLLPEPQALSAFKLEAGTKLQLQAAAFIMPILSTISGGAVYFALQQDLGKAYPLLLIPAVIGYKYRHILRGYVQATKDAFKQIAENRLANQAAKQLHTVRAQLLESLVSKLEETTCNDLVTVETPQSSEQVNL